MSKRVIVTGSHTFFATRLIHEFGRLGCEVTAADSQRISAGKGSRFASRRLRLPSLAEQPGEYLATLTRELRTRHYDLLVPTFEEALLLSEFSSAIPAATRCFLSPFETMWQLHHKPSLYELGNRLDIPVPLTIYPRDIDHFNDIVDMCPLPAVLKLPTTNNSVGRRFCDSRDALLVEYKALSDERTAHDPPFVQKKIDGTLVFSLYLCRKGEVVGEVVYRTRRTFPQEGGTAVDRESIHHAEISRLSRRLIAKTHWDGFLGLDYIVENETRIPYLIDANPRSSPAMHLGFLGGVNWARQLLDMAEGNNPEPAIAEPGCCAHSLLLDAGWLLEGFSSHAGGWRQLPRRLWKFLVPGWKVNSRDDLLTTREWRSLIMLFAHAGYSLAKSILTRRQLGEVLLTSGNYHPDTVALYRAAQGRGSVADIRRAA